MTCIVSTYTYLNCDTQLYMYSTDEFTSTHFLKLCRNSVVLFGMYIRTSSIVAIVDWPYSGSKSSHYADDMSVLPIPPSVTDSSPLAVVEHLHTPFVLAARPSEVGVDKSNKYVRLGWKKEGERGGKEKEYHIRIELRILPWTPRREFSNAAEYSNTRRPGVTAVVQQGY